MRWRVVVPLVVVAAVAGGAAFVVVDRTDGTSPTPTTTASAGPTRPAVLDPLGTAASLPAKSSVRRALAAGLQSLPVGEQYGAAVLDVATGTTLWSRDAHAAITPASTLKVLTAAAALRTLGSTYRFTTTAKLAGSTVYLVGGGDPTLVRTTARKDRPVRYPVPASLAALAAQTAAALPPGQAVRLRADASAWSSPELAKGWNDGYVPEGDVTPPTALELNGGRLRPAEFDSPRTPDPAGQAVDAFAALLRDNGVTVTGAVKRATAPTTATELAKVSSPPLGSLVARLLTDSDNDLAEALGRAIAVSHGLPATFEGAAAALTTEMAAIGVPREELNLQDASGLSHDDTLTASALVTVLRAAAGDPALRPVIEGLPVGGFTGTLAGRYRGSEAGAGTGMVRAKTGSLVGVNALAGVVADRSGRLLVFALLGYGTFETAAVQSGLDAAASGLAGLE
jgi:D-alanyl-D-alanine carboxypeptidase/D-alanyl-D-alanine-endopeptidase (penicillin-binding protein 4)